MCTYILQIFVYMYQEKRRGTHKPVTHLCVKSMKKNILKPQFSFPRITL